MGHYIRVGEGLPSDFSSHSAREGTMKLLYMTFVIAFPAKRVAAASRET